jgi:hypothetical protein
MLYLIMKNKDEFYQALKGLEKYSTSVCKLIDTFLKIESDCRVTASIEYLMEATGSTKPTIYSSIKTLKKDHIIMKNNDYRNTYDFNVTKVNDIICQYKKQQSIILH